MEYTPNTDQTLYGNAFKSVLQGYYYPLNYQAKKQTNKNIKKTKKFVIKYGSCNAIEMKQGKMIYSCNYSGDI